MAVTSSIGPGAANMVTAAALAHVNRLPVLLIPGDVFANRGPDPVLQQLEDFGDGTMTVNDCFRPVSRYFDRIMRPEQLLTALPRAMRTMTDPADCGPVTLAFCGTCRRKLMIIPSASLKARLASTPPGTGCGGIRRGRRRAEGCEEPRHRCRRRCAFSGATETLKRFAETHSIPVVETGPANRHWRGITISISARSASRVPKAPIS